MGDWDAPSPWYVYTLGGLAFAEFACLGNSQWRWAFGIGLALVVNIAFCVWKLKCNRKENNVNI